jgi:hypothetical protein
VAVWQWLAKPESDAHDLYAGRISLEQVAEIKQTVLAKNLTSLLHYPAFIQDHDKYLAIIKQIGLTNEFEALIV